MRKTVILHLHWKRQKEYEFLQTRVLTGLENTGTDNTQQADDTAADTTTEGNGQ